MIYFKGSCFKFTRETHQNRAVFEEAQTELFNLNLCFDQRGCALRALLSFLEVVGYTGRTVHSLSKVVRLIVLYY